GHTVVYRKIGDKDNPQDLGTLLEQCIAQNNAEKFEYQLPDEYRLDKQLKEICRSLPIPSEAFDTEHFYTTRNELGDFFGKKQLLMESFYRMMRKKHNVLMINGQPEGGQWNFDQNNRKKWTGNPKIPREIT